MRRAFVGCLLLLAAGCGSSASQADRTSACLEKQAGVSVVPTPKSQLAQFGGATDVLSVTWLLAHQTPPATAVVMFAKSEAAERAMETSLAAFARNQAHVSLRNSLHRRGKVAWAWIGRHNPAEARSLARCLSSTS